MRDHAVAVSASAAKHGVSPLLRACLVGLNRRFRNSIAAGALEARGKISIAALDRAAACEPVLQSREDARVALDESILSNLDANRGGYLIALLRLTSRFVLPVGAKTDGTLVDLGQGRESLGWRRRRGRQVDAGREPPGRLALSKGRMRLLERRRVCLLGWLLLVLLLALLLRRLLVLLLLLRRFLSLRGVITGGV